MKTRRGWGIALALVMTLLLGHSYAQKTTGSISGTVADASGSVVAGATVTATNPSTGSSRTSTTNDQGQYTIGDLPYGDYQIDIKATNYKASVTKGVAVQVATNATVNVQLEIGSVADTVTVQADAVQVQTDGGSLGTVIDGRQVKELPLNGRSFVELTQLQPGVSAANNFDTKNKGLQGGVDMSVNGNPTTNNLFLIDGVNNNDTGSNRTILIYPSNEAIAEFKFVTNSFGAEYGQASGGVISIVTRGGTNQFHGSAFYDGRNDALSAYTYFAAQNAGKGLPLDGKDKLRRNDWGYSVGGPVLKDKLFFFWSQEWNHEIRGRTVGACVPTAAEAAGDFTALSCGGTAATAPVIPAQFQAGGNPRALNAVDPSAATILKILPAPNLAALNSQGQNWSESLPTALYWREENIRVDYNLTPRNAIMGRYTQDSWSNPAYNAGYWGDDPYPALNSSWAQPSKSIVGRWTATISNSLVNDAEFQYSNNRIAITPGGTDPSLLAQVSDAIAPLYSNALKRSSVGVPQVNLGVYSGSGGATTQLIAPWQNQLNLYTFQDNVSKALSRQTFKFGALLDWDGKDEDTGPASSERPQVNTADSNIAPTGFATGNNLANFLIPGNVFNISETSTNVRAQLRWRDYEFYATDNIKITPRITLDVGVRYSYMTPTFQPSNQLTNFQPSLYDPSKPASDACNGLWIAKGTDPCGAANKQFGTQFSSGVVGPNKYLVNVNNHLFAPRVGVAWDVFGNGRTAVRLGAGQFFQRERVSRYTLVSNAPFALNASNIPRTLAGGTPAAVTGTASPAGGYDPKALVPNSWQWNATVEQSLAKNTILSMSYVGNRGIHLTSSYDINQVPQQNWLNASFANGSAVNAYRPFSNYGTLTWWAHDGNSNYNSLQVFLRTRVKEVQLTAAYTWSHSIADIVLDDSGGGLGSQTRTYYPNPRLDRGNGDTNRPNSFVANATYFLPLMSSSGPLVRNTVGGWELTGITTASAGNSFTIYQGVSEDSQNLAPGQATSLNSLTQTGFTNPLRPLTTGQSCTANRKGSQIVNPGAFTLIGYQIGTIPTNTEPRGFCGGPNFVNTDLSIDKNWKVFKERATIQFRLDLFDLFNHANFNASNGSFTPFSQVNCGPLTADGYNACSPTNNVVSAQTAQSGFGNSSATIGNASRQIQYGLHVNF